MPLAHKTMATAWVPDKFYATGGSSTEAEIMKITRTITLVMAFTAILTTTAFAGDKLPAPNIAQKETPAANPDLIGRIDGLAQMIIDLEEGGQLNHGQAKSLINKLAKAQNALQTAGAEATSSDVAAQQSALGNLSKAVKAVTGFLRELTRIVTDLPAEVVQPIINATLDLIDELVGLLL